VSPKPDAARLLAAIADALNAAERAGITVEHPTIALMTSHGDVLPIGDDRLGIRWEARPKVPHAMSPGKGSDDD
jgi:hypothetical protein